MNLLTTLAACLALSFMLSGLESAILSLNPARLRHAAKEGRRRARLLERLLGHKDLTLASLLLANAAVNLLMFALITAEMVDRLGAWGYPAAFLLCLPIYLVWVEMLPKSLFKRAPLGLLLFFAPVLALLHVTIRPLFLLLALPCRWTGRLLLGRNPSRRAENRAEFRALTESLEREGSLAPQETAMIRGVLDFQRVTVREVMLSLSRVTAVPSEMPMASVVALARQTKIDQFPVMGPSGDLIGLVNVVEVLRDHGESGTAQQHRHKLVRSQPGEPAIAVLRRLRHAGHEIAAVYNEENRPLGIVSVEDMVSRLTLGAA